MSEGKKVTVSARVTLTVEVYVGPWDHTVELLKLYEQAGREATDNLRYLLQNTGRLSGRVIGEPKVQAVLVEDR